MMIDSFLSEGGILVVMAIFAIAASWPVLFVVGVPLLVWSMLRGEQNE
jgi:hypothetical protein